MPTAWDSPSIAWDELAIGWTGLRTPIPTPELATDNILGCSNEYRVFVADRAGKELLVDLTYTDITWERVESGVSTATIEVKGVSGEVASDCCAELEGVDAWANEVHIYRNGERIWAGPITNMEMDDSGYTLRASDVAAWLGERRIHTTQIHKDEDLAEIFASYVTDAMSVDNVPGIVVASRPTGRTATRKVLFRERKNALAELSELARTGIRWTVLDRTLLINAARERVILTDEHIRAAGSITVDGKMATEVTVIGSARAQGRPQVVGVARTEDASIIDQYGVHEMVASEDRIKDNASATFNARRRLGRYERPAVLFTGGDLEPSFPVTQMNLVPGMLVDARLDQQCRGVNGVFRVTKITGTFSQSVDTIAIDVQPPGRGEL